MESEQKRLKVKIISLAVSILVCVVLVGVSVWAALTQNVKITNTITISASGQTKVEVVVSEYIHAGKTGITAAPTDSITDSETSNKDGWYDLLSKTSDEDSKEGAATPIVFNYSDGNNYYAYKFDFSNESDEIVYAHITADVVNNTELTIYYGETWGATMTALTNNVALDTDVTLQAATDDGATPGTGTFYIVVCANEGLDELTEVEDAINFNINIVLDQTESVGA